MKQRIKTAIILLLITLPILLFNDIFLLIALPFLSYFAMSEVLRAFRIKLGTPMYIFSCIAPLMFVLTEYLAFLHIVHVIVLLLFIYILYYVFKYEVNVATVSVVLLLILFIGFALVGSVQVRGFGRATFIYMIIATFFTDIGAYLVGVKFGKHKLIEYVSPKKTIEGSIGGVVFSMLASIFFAIKMNLPYPITFIVVSSSVLAIFAQFGDLFFSALKREVKIKDFGTVLPGHGGILDRFDSLFCNIIVFAFLLSFINYF